MPIYEYQCSKCEHKMEVLQKISDTALLDCPSCEMPNLNKLISAASFRLKGGGWYETDFKTGNKKQLAESESASSKSPDSTKAEADKQKKSSSGADQKTSSSANESKSTGKANENSKPTSSATKP